MTVKCKICNKEMPKQITNTHLKIHSMTTTEYKALYGKDALLCSEFRRQLSDRNTGKNNPNFGKKWSNDQKNAMSKKQKGIIPWNKGTALSGNHLEIAQRGVKKREGRYTTGELIRHVSKSKTKEQKKILSIKQQEYAKNNPEEMSQRAYKAIETRRKNGHDLAFFRNKTHSEGTKQKLSVISKDKGVSKTEKSKQRITNNAALANCIILSFNGKLVNLKCTRCEYEFTLGKQCFNDTKNKIERCPSCYPYIPNKRSAGEQELYSFIESLGVKAIPNHRLIFGKKEIDIYLPDHNIAIEYNGLYWHSEKLLESIGYSKTKDNEKRIELNNLGIRYIAIFEDEWLNQTEIVKSRLSNLLQKTSIIVYARKCKISEIDSRTASRFCEDNHIQGKGRSNARYGLYYNNELVSVMTFSKNNISRKISTWELNRFCSKINISVVGGASRLFSIFIKEYNPASIVTYADNRWSQGNLYKQLGFSFSRQTVPNYWYLVVNNLKRIHRFALRKNKDDDQSKTEKQLRDEQGYLRIWDCGSSKWIWTANKNGDS